MPERTGGAKAIAERAISPGYSICQRCERPWRFVEPHIVPLLGPDGPTQLGKFALCESCWDGCDVRDRVVYVAEAHRKFWKDDWDIILASVLADSEERG